MKKKTKFTNTSFVITIMFIFITISVFFFFKQKSDKRFKQMLLYAKFTNAQIIDTKSFRLSGINLKYEFWVKNYKYSKETHYLEIPSSFSPHFLNKSYPVVYDSNNPNVNYLLFIESDFEKIGLDYPDSLKWMNKYIKN